MKKVNLLTKAQITAFILIGIIVFMLFLFLYFISPTNIQVKLTTKMEKIASDILYSETVRIYTKTCLDKTLRQGLVLLGKQGGIVNTSFFETLSDASYFERNGQPIQALIKTDTRSIPRYPCDTVVCDFINTPDYIKSEYNLAGTRFKFGRQEVGLISNSRIETELAKYIAYNLPKCTNFTSLLEIPELAGTDIIEELPIATVSIGEKDVKVEIKYPITLILVDKDPVIFLLEFNSKADVRLKKILEAVSQQTELDNRYLNYNISDTKIGITTPDTEKEYSSFESILSGAVVSLAPGNDADIITITDHGSRIGPESYIFRYARANRPPVLDYISNQPKLNEFDYKADMNQQSIISLNPQATDPDEDIVVYNFTGWEQEDFNSTYQHTLDQDDIGIQNLRLTVYDKPTGDDIGLFDYQDIIFLICAGKEGEKNECDLDCGASEQCDEKELQNNILPGGLEYCDTECQYHNCPTGINQTPTPWECMPA